MTNEPVDTVTRVEGPDELQEQQEQEERTGSPYLAVHFRLKPHEIVFFKRMADHFWRQGTIREPTFNAIGKACLNIVANKYAKVEKKNYDEYIARRLQTARDSATLRPRELYNPRYKPEFAPARDYFDATEQPRIPAGLRSRF